MKLIRSKAYASKERVKKKDSIKYEPILPRNMNYPDKGIRNITQIHSSKSIGTSPVSTRKIFLCFIIFVFRCKISNIFKSFKKV